MPVISTADKNSKPNGIDDKNMSHKKSPEAGHACRKTLSSLLLFARQWLG